MNSHNDMTGQRELLSIIVPVYNVEEFLPSCIESILGSTYSNLELILVDDGSSDSSGSICDEYARLDSRVHVIHQENQTQSAARNAGLEVATGSFITFVDSDDAIDLGGFEHMMSAAVTENADVVAADISKFLDLIPQDQPVLSQQHDVMDKRAALVDLFTDNHLRFEVWNKIYSRESIGDLRFKVGQLHEEVYFTPRVFLKVNKVVRLTDKFYKYRLDRPGNTNSKFPESRFALVEEFRSLSSLFENLGDKELVNLANRTLLEYILTFYKMSANLNGINHPLTRRCIEEFSRTKKLVSTASLSFDMKLKTALFQLSPKAYLLLSEMRNK